MTRLPPPCVGWDEDLSAFLDGELAPEREEEVRLHLDACDACVRRLEAFAAVGAALAAESPHPEPGPVHRVGRATASAPRVRSRPRAAAPRRGRWLGAAAGAAGAVAAAAVALILARSEPPVRVGALPTPAPALPRVAATEKPATSGEVYVARRSEDEGPAGASKAPAVAEQRSVVAAARSAPEGPRVEVEEADARLAAASDDELDLATDLDTIEDLDLIRNLELVELLAARDHS
ncbi:MAG TPA: zf-HC2 domain-containing protein [Myxococcota bacterium]|nr:zf-HC2 domain-containing protein [Myxococcota bacterium]